MEDEVKKTMVTKFSGTHGDIRWSFTVEGGPVTIKDFRIDPAPAKDIVAARVEANKKYGFESIMLNPIDACYLSGFTPSVSSTADEAGK